jgi:hypothetical protein
LAVWLVLAAAETRSVGRNRCFYSPAVAVSWFEKAKPWVFLIWSCSLLPLEAAVVIFVVSKFDNDLPISFLVFQIKLNLSRFRAK